MKVKLYTLSRTGKTIILRSLLLLSLCFAFSSVLLWGDAPSHPETSGTSSDSLFYNTYEIEERTYYLVPQELSEENLTEFDWIEMQPRTQKRRHKVVMHADFSTTTRIDILESNLENEWDHKISHIIIDEEGSRAYGEENELISSMPTGDFSRETNQMIAQQVMEQGFSPRESFPTYEDLPIEEILHEGYQLEETANGYKFWNDMEEVIVNLEMNAITVNSLIPSEGAPYFTFHSFTESQQGYLMPVVTETRTKVRTENGYEIVEVHLQQYTEQLMFYDPQMISETEMPSIALDFTLYPNPVENEFEISYTGEDLIGSQYSISIIEPTTGATILEVDGLQCAEPETIDISDFHEGMYFVRFNVEGSIFNKSILKQ